MNRNQEYLELNQELAGLRAPGGSVLRAAARQRRKRRVDCVLRPLAGLAAVFALFFLLVNLSPAVAEACEEIPILGDLSHVMRFTKSSSLAAAVENGYYQKVGQSQTVDGVAICVDYLIVDEKALTVLYRVETPEGAARAPVYEPFVPGTISWSWGPSHDPNYDGYIGSMLFAGSTPEQLTLQFGFEEMEEDDPIVEFQLEFDPRLVAETRHYDVDRVLDLDGQRLRITEVDLYPSVMHLRMEADPENTAEPGWFGFYALTENGTRCEKSKLFNPFDYHYELTINEDGSFDCDPEQLQNPDFDLYLESPYFENPTSLTFCAEGEKVSMEYKTQGKSSTTLCLKLADGSTEGFPPDVELVECSPLGNGDWRVVLQNTQPGRELICWGSILDDGLGTDGELSKDADPDPSVVDITLYHVITEAVQLRLDYRITFDEPITATLELNP